MSVLTASAALHQLGSLNPVLITLVSDCRTRTGLHIAKDLKELSTAHDTRSLWSRDRSDLSNTEPLVVLRDGGCGAIRP